MISETLSDHIEQNTAPDVVSYEKNELNKMPEVNNLQQKKLEQIINENDTLLENQSDKTITSTPQEKTKIDSDIAIQPTLFSDMDPVELFNYLASSTPRMLFVLYLLILFTWSYLQRSPLLLLSLGVVFGYFVRANTEVKEKIVMVKDTSISKSSVEVSLWVFF